MMPTIRIDGEVFRYLQGKARPLVDSPNDVLRREFGLDGATLVARLKANGGGNGKNSADREVSVHKSGNSYAFYIARDWAKRMGVQSHCKMLARFDGATLVARLKANGSGNGKNSGDREVSVHKSGNSYAFYIPRDWAKRMGVGSRCKMLVRFDGATLVARLKANGGGNGKNSATAVTSAAAA